MGLDIRCLSLCQRRVHGLWDKIYGAEMRREMADKKLVEAITSMDEDFAQWYTDVVKKAELIDYSNVKGCMVIKPAGYAIWELIQRQLDDMFKATGVENVYMPMFIPEGLLQKEKDHVEGFCPGSGMGDPWRIEPIAGEDVRKAYFGNPVLRFL